MAKRKTKAQREAGAKAALHQRVADIVAGACGNDMDNDMSSVLCDQLPLLVGGIKARLIGDDPEREYLTSICNADEYETVERLTEFLWRHGIRA